MFSGPPGVFCKDIALLKERAFVTGLRRMGSQEAKQRGFVPGALVPDVTQWPPAPLDDLTAEALVATKETPAWAQIELVKFTPDQIQTLGRLIIDQCQKPISNPHARDHEIITLPRGIPARLFPTYPISPSRTLCTTKTQPAIETYYKSDTPLSVGLHFDDHYHGAVSVRHTSPHTMIMCMKGSRYSLTLLGPTSAALAANLHPGQPDYVPNQGDAAAYYTDEQLAQAKVLWLRFSGGEAYISPTELLLHDGSTYRQPETSAIAFFHLLDGARQGRWTNAL
jgi:hypothetical protein